MRNQKIRQHKRDGNSFYKSGQRCSDAGETRGRKQFFIFLFLTRKGQGRSGRKPWPTPTRRWLESWFPLAADESRGYNRSSMSRAVIQAILMVGCFAGGTGAGWLLWGSDRSRTDASGSDPVEFHSPRAHGERSGTTPSRYRAAVKTSSHEELRKMIDTASPGEFPALMEALAQNAGINGLDQRGQQLLQDMMRRWHAAAPEEALAWALGQWPDRDRHFHLETILREVEKGDFHAAMDFIETHLKGDGFAVEIPRTMLERAAAEGPEMLIRLLAASAGESDGGSGWNVHFPVGYDFQSLMTQLTELQASLPPGHRLATIPSNVIEEWVNSDPREAYEWLRGSEHNLFLQGMDDFYRAYGNLVDSELYGGFAAEVFSTDPDPQAAATSALLALASKPEIGVMESFLGSLPAERRESVLEEIYGAANGRSGLGIGPTRRLVLEQMGSEGRESFLRRQDVSESIKNGVPGILLGLGYSEEEVLELIPPQE